MRTDFVSPVGRAVRAGALAALTLAFAPRPAVAQTAADNAAALRTSYLASLEEVQGKFLQLAEAFPADKYAWRPAPGVRSVGEVFMHVASEYYVYTPMSYGAARSPVIERGEAAFKAFESKSTKADVQKHLKEGFAYMKTQLEGLDPAAITGTQKLFGGDHTIVETSFIMSGDLHEHLGQLIAYARQNGVKPPWSK